ncbi:hypothetical protein [Burkholderia pyrrocinia]
MNTSVSGFWLPLKWTVRAVARQHGHQHVDQARRVGVEHLADRAGTIAHRHADARLEQPAVGQRELLRRVQRNALGRRKRRGFTRPVRLGDFLQPTVLHLLLQLNRRMVGLDRTHRSPRNRNKP